MIRAFVFCRGGSKGLPGKNTRLLNGKPLLAYSIEHAKACKHISTIAVSSDSDEILQVASKYGAITIRRPLELATDDCPEILAWKHACHVMGAFDTFVSVPAVTPLRTPDHIDGCIEALSDNDGAVAVCHSKSYHKLATVENGLVRPLDGRQRQECQTYEITGSVYAMKRDYLLKTERIFDGMIVPVVVPPTVDIDTLDDFNYAEYLMKG